MNWPPNVTRTYQNHTIDSTRWRGFEPRAGDVIVTTSYKSGTTWTLGVLYRMLALKEGFKPLPIDYWIDARMFPVDLGEQLAELAAMPHRRVLKSHLAADGLPVWPEVFYIVVGRDPRDVFMSLVNHYDQFSDTAYQMFNETPGRVGDPMPRWDGDVHRLWRNWMTRGWFEWESEGWPWWGNLHHVATWWAVRRQPNVLFVHFNDLKRSLSAEVARIARFIGVQLGTEDIQTVVADSSLDAMRASAIAAASPIDLFFRDGARGFFYKGTNERWRSVLSPEELALYDAAKARVLPEGCSRWLETGGPIEEPARSA